MKGNSALECLNSNKFNIHVESDSAVLQLMHLSAAGHGYWSHPQLAPPHHWKQPGLPIKSL